MTHQRAHFTNNLTQVWLTANIDEADCYTPYVWNISDSVQTFTDVDRCVDFITEIIDEKFFIVISSELGQ
jgi:hypothetical protein